MKITFTLLFCLLFTSMQAQTNTWEWAITVPHMGQTSEMRGIAADKEGNSIVVGQMREPFSGFQQGVAIAKYDAKGVRQWTYNLPGAYFNGDKAMKATCDDDLNIYALITYTTKVLVVDGDSVDNSDMALLKLDKDGTLQFIKAAGSSAEDKVYGMEVKGNELWVRAIGNGGFDRDGISYTFPMWGRPYFMVYDLAGSVKASSILGIGYTEPVHYLEQSGSDYFGYIGGVTVTKFKANTTNHTPAVEKTLDLKNMNGGGQLQVMDIKGTENGRIYATGFFKSRYILLEGDTLHNLNNTYPTCFLIEMDQDLKVKNHILYYDEYGIQRQNEIQKLTVYKNEKIAVMNYFARNLHFPNDSLVAANLEWCASVVELNLDLSVRTMNQVNVKDKAGWDSRDFGYDGLGNLFCLFTHEEDMYFNQTLVKSANKSWAHLSALGKLGTGQSVSARKLTKEIGFKVYPNPSTGTLSIESESGVAAVKIYDLSGKLLLTSGSATTMDIQSLKAGVYVLELENSLGQKTATRIVKTDR
ncbi:MAG: T9SS type A sorting domain-containing protein [Bacteroidetes bacterium]|nr:MAG: T9SS type A sorting domain-containing protein [Bacteroidota bacterium]